MQNTIFQSTRPVRGETLGLDGIWSDIGDFNPLAPCGARHLERLLIQDSPKHFNPLAPCGARPAARSNVVRARVIISIHSPRAGRDQAWIHL